MNAKAVALPSGLPVYPTGLSANNEVCMNTNGGVLVQPTDLEPTKDSVGIVGDVSGSKYPLRGADNGDGTSSLQVADNIVIITPTITVSTSPAYTAGDSIGGKITLASALARSAGVAELRSIVILDRANQKPAGDILIFEADPTLATLTDNSAVALSTNDLNIIARIPVAASDYVTINSKAIANLSGLSRFVKSTTGTSLYAAFVVTTTPTFAATTDVQIRFGFRQS